jgi:hypothetical protein
MLEPDVEDQVQWTHVDGVPAMPFSVMLTTSLLSILAIFWMLNVLLSEPDLSDPNADRSSPGWEPVPSRTSPDLPPRFP